MLLESKRTVSWLKFRTQNEHIIQYDTTFGRRNLIAWTWVGVPNTDEGFYPRSTEIDLFISDIIPVPASCDVWIGTRMDYGKG